MECLFQSMKIDPNTDITKWWQPQENMSTTPRQNTSPGADCTTEICSGSARTQKTLKAVTRAKEQMLLHSRCFQMFCATLCTVHVIKKRSSFQATHQGFFTVASKARKKKKTNTKQKHSLDHLCWVNVSVLKLKIKSSDSRPYCVLTVHFVIIIQNGIS